MYRLHSETGWRNGPSKDHTVAQLVEQADINAITQGGPVRSTLHERTAVQRIRPLRGRSRADHTTNTDWRPYVGC